MSHIKEKIMENELVKIRITALMDIYCHAFRFCKKNNPPNKNQCVYGFLKGKIEGTTRIITEVETILHNPTPDLVFDDNFFKDMDDFNARYIEEESFERIIGWYKSTTQDVRFKAIDVRNHLKFQTLNKLYIGMILNPLDFLNAEGYGFSFYTLIPDSYGEYNIMSGAAKIPWEIMPLGDDKDLVIRHMKEYIIKTVYGKELVTELSEAFDDI
ncbi:MAG: hypothetical protein ACTSRZ_12775 [Promethearchaeota archaeon]